MADIYICIHAFTWGDNKYADGRALGIFHCKPNAKFATETSVQNLNILSIYK